MRLLIVASVILTVFAIIASAAHDGLCLGVTADTWFFAAFLAFVVDLLLGSRAILPVTGFATHQSNPQAIPPQQ